MMTQIKCMSHNEEDIILLDISQFSQRQTRVYCLECLNKIKLQRTCQIKKMPEKIKEYSTQASKEIKKEYDPWIAKISKTIKQLNSIKEKLLKNLQLIIGQAEQCLRLFSQQMLSEVEYLENLTSDLTRTKLEQIAEMLSGTYQRETKSNELQADSEIFYADLSLSLNQLMLITQQFNEEIGELFTKKISLKFEQKQETHCRALACNKQKKIIGYGNNKDMIIQEQEENQFTKSIVLEGHTDIILAMAIYSSGDKIVTATSNINPSIQLWFYKVSKWNCIQKIKEHKFRVTDLLISNQEKLITASEDQLIKIWKLTQEIQLQCIQTLDVHNNCVYWISINPDSQFMVSSSCQRFFIILKQENLDENPWKTYQIIQNQGQINRVFFTALNQLIVQQVEPPQIYVYQANQNMQYQAEQVLILNQQDNKEILFPIFEIKSLLFIKNSKFLYIIKRLNNGKYYIQQIMNGWFISGCIDSSGECVILLNADKLSIQVYNI